MEKVKEFFKNNKIAVTIITVVLLIAIIAVAVVLIQKNSEKKKEEEKNESIKNAISDYVVAYNELDKDKMLAAIDSKAACAWANCEADTTKFKEQYDKVTDEDKKSYEDNNIVSRVEMLKTFYETYLDYHKMELASIKDTKDIEGVDGLLKSTATIKESYSYDGQEQQSEQEVYFYIYNGKIVSMEEASKEDESNKSTDEENKTDDKNETNTKKDEDNSKKNNDKSKNKK